MSALQVQQALEVCAVLARLCELGTAIVLASPEGQSLSGRLRAVDADGGRLHFGVDAQAPQLAGLLAADEAVAVCHLDRVQLQFTLHGLVLVRGADDHWLQTDWPEQMLRLQRRETYRVDLSQRSTPSVRLRHPAMPDMLLELRLLDLSIGGCALLLPPDVPELRPGIRLRGVRVQLDSGTHFDGGLLLQHLSMFDGEDGPRRVGCSWDELSPEAERTLQRYILHAQQRTRRRP